MKRGILSISAFISSPITLGTIINNIIVQYCKKSIVIANNTDDLTSEQAIDQALAQSTLLPKKASATQLDTELLKCISPFIDNNEKLSFNDISDIEKLNVNCFFTGERAAINTSKGHITLSQSTATLLYMTQRLTTEGLASTTTVRKTRVATNFCTGKKTI